jgi:hypothetical protein
MHSQSPRPAPRVATFLRSADVAAITQVVPKVISLWAQDGRSPHQRTLSGRRSPAATVHQLAASPVREVCDR